MIELGLELTNADTLTLQTELNDSQSETFLVGLMMIAESTKGVMRIL